MRDADDSAFVDEWYGVERADSGISDPPILHPWVGGGIANEQWLPVGCHLPGNAFTLRDRERQLEVACQTDCGPHAQRVAVSEKHEGYVH